MKCIRTIVFAGAVLGACCGLQAAGYIKFDGIDGEAADKDHKQWIDVVSVSGVTETREAGTGMATGRRTYEPIRFTKRIDKSTPLLAKALAEGKHFPIVVISVDGRDCVLTGAKITAVTAEGANEVVTFTYQKIEWKQAVPPPRERPAPQQQSAAPARAGG